MGDVEPVDAAADGRVVWNRAGEGRDPGVRLQVGEERSTRAGLDDELDVGELEPALDRVQKAVQVGAEDQVLVDVVVGRLESDCALAAVPGHEDDEVVAWLRGEPFLFDLKTILYCGQILLTHAVLTFKAVR